MNDMNNEPITITVGEYVVSLTETGQTIVVQQGSDLAFDMSAMPVIAALTRELAEARKDSARLDWLESSGRVAIQHLRNGVMQEPFTKGTLRSAIDAALSGSETQA